MNVISLFDWAGQWLAVLNQMGITPKRYFSSEVDKYAIKLLSDNFHGIEHIGSVTDVSFEPYSLWRLLLCGDAAYDIDGIDFLIMWPPCTNLSIAGKRQGLWASTLEEYFELKRRYQNIKNWNPQNEKQEATEFLINFFEKTQSHLFWEGVRILREVKPKVFFVENVSWMDKTWKEVYTRALFGIEPMYIDSRLTSAQTRKRLYWFGVRQPDGTYKGVDIPQPEDAGILLKDILEDIPFDEVDKKGELIWKPVPEKYLGIVEERIAKGNMSLFNTNPSGRGMNWNVINAEWKLWTLTTNKWEWLKICVRIPEATKKGFVELQEWDCVDMAQPNSATPRGRMMRDKLNGITTSPQFMTIGRFQIPHGNNSGWLYSLEKACAINANGDYANNNKLVWEYEAQYYWRKLTVRECARAQSFPEWYSFDSISPSRAYKAIGNSWEGWAIKHIWKYLLPYVWLPYPQKTTKR